MKFRSYNRQKMYRKYKGKTKLSKEELEGRKIKRTSREIMIATGKIMLNLKKLVADRRSSETN
jgi:hypothetical protein